jgi:hypothetical protein
MRRAIFWVCFCQLVLAVASLGQVNRASITGTVTDRSGAVMAGVKVTARNIGTDEQTTSVSNADGIYLVPNLPPGAYALAFEKDGFKKFEEPSITLESTQVAGINVVMQVGNTSEKIVVNTDAPVLDNESATIGTNLNGKILTDLPLSIYGGGRFVEDFAVALTPGYSPISDPFQSVVNGGQYFTKDYTVDGTSAVSSIRGNSIETGPSMEAVQELQAQTSGLDALGAITTGGVIALTLKSGTDQFHGSTFGYGHNEVLDANTWTNGAEGLPRARRRAWDYGASLGGPIRKDKTFFFGTFERYTQTDFTPGDYNAFVPTQPMLGGDFSALLGSNLCNNPANGNMGNCGQPDDNSGTFSTAINVQNNAGQTVPLQVGMIFDPQTGHQFTSNMIPSTRFSTTSQKIIPLFQKYYVPERGGLLTNERTPQSGFPQQTPIQAVVKLDHNLGSHDRLSGSWIYNHRPTVQVDSGGVWSPGSTDGGPLSSSQLKLVRSYEYRASESHVFSSNLLNVLNFTYNWYWNGQVPTSSGTNWNSQLGFGNTNADNFPNISFGNQINGVGVTGIGSSAQKHFAGATALVDDAVTWVNGRHAVSFGGDFRAYQVNSHTSTGVLNYNFDPTYTAGAYAGSNVIGFGFASFLLGHAQNAGETVGSDLYGRRKSTSIYGQDSYKVTPKFTLNLGLRWNYSGRYHEKYGHWANFDLSAIETNPAFPWVGLPGSIVYAKGGGDSFEKKEYWTNFGPQIGFAYSPRNRWVVRGSFGIIYLPPIGPYYNGVPNGFAPGFQGTNVVNAPFQWDGLYPGKTVPGSKNVDPSTQYYLTTVDPHALMAGLSQAFNIGIQRELTKDLRVEVAYVGNRGHHLPDTALAYNQPSAKQLLNVVNANPGLVTYGAFDSWNFSGTGCTKGGPILNNFGFGPGTYVGLTCPYTGFVGPALAALAPYPQVADWSSRLWFGSAAEPSYVGLPLGQSFYNSMVVDLVKRTGRGLTMDLNYTLSRTEGDTFSSQQEYNGFYTPVQDFSNISQAAHTVTGYDQTHVVKGFAVYELPFGKGRRWLSNSGRTVNALAGGWTLTGLVQYRSGQPFQMGISQPYYPLYSTFYPNFHLSGFTGPSDPHKFQAGPCGQPGLPPCLFYLPQSIATSPIPADTSKGTVALGTGPAAIPDLRCPGHANEDISVLKYFTMGADGRYQLSLRGEFYNLFNRHEYAINGCSGTGPQNKVGASNFGQVTGIIENPRNGQFAVRFTF